MKTKNLISVCGSVTKRESLLPLTYNILENTYVAEADMPYSGYYGHTPGQATPNSLFLFTTHYYSLEEILRFVQNIESCYMENVNIASASLDFGTSTLFAIRVKYFSEYEHIHLLQSCFMKEGVEFVRKVRLPDFAKVKVDKCFVLEEIGEGIYIDNKEDHKGYITISKQITDSEFSNVLIDIRNNTDCKLFDAAIGAMIIESKVIDLVRIYSENLNPQLLKCIKERFNRINS